MKPAAFGSKLAGIAVLGLSLALPVIAANGRRHGGEMEMDGPPPDDTEYPPTYFAHPEHRQLILAHIVLMTLAWVIFLPVGMSCRVVSCWSCQNSRVCANHGYKKKAVFLSLAKSRYVLPSQFVFLGTNALGLILGTIYNASTPDLFPNNAHHRIGWIITWVVSAQVVISLLRRIGGALQGVHSELAEERRSFIPLPTDAPEAATGTCYGDRLSNDSGQGSEPTTESLRSNSISTLGDHEHQPMSTFNKELDEEDDEDDEDGPMMPMPEARPQSKTTLVVIKVVSSRVWKYLDFGYKVVDRIILPFGFIAYTSGIATYGRLFVRIDPSFYFV